MRTGASATHIFDITVYRCIIQGFSRRLPVSSPVSRAVMS